MLGFGPIGTAPLGSSPPPWFLANFAKQRQKPDEDRIFAAFGRFIASYALAEAGVHIAARFFSEMPDNKARVIFSGMRGKDVSGCLRQFVVDNATAAPDVEEIIRQLHLITEARNQFVHRLIEYDHGRGLTVTNRLISDADEDHQPKIFSVADLENMDHDCRLIFGRLVSHCDKMDELKLISEFSLLGLYAPWRYIPPSPKNKAPPNPGDRGSRKRQRRTSRVSPPPHQYQSK